MTDMASLTHRTEPAEAEALRCCGSSDVVYEGLVQASLVRSGVYAETFQRLRDTQGTRAKSLFALWLVLVEHGEEAAKARFSRATFYRNIKLLQDTDISWHDAGPRAEMLLREGDESIYRAHVASRFVVECIVTPPAGNFTQAIRRRKFSSPLYMTSEGPIEAYPESDADLFISLEAATDAIKRFGGKKTWWTTSTTLEKERKSRRYLRWVAEVKDLDGEYKEPRRTLEEKAAIFSENGLQGLRKMYSKSHAIHTVSALRLHGLSTGSEDQNTYDRAIIGDAGKRT